MNKNAKGENGKEIALEARSATEERLFSPSAARNRDAIRDVFFNTMFHEGVVLEVGSGTGEHAAHITAAAPKLTWLPGDPDATSRRSIAAWAEHLEISNMAAPHAIDVAAPNWRHPDCVNADGVVSINMIHIAPFEAATGLIAGAGEILNDAGKLFLYGPFSRNGAHTAPSNADFDASLKSRDPRWGVRDLDRDIVPLAERAGLRLDQVVEMPANNFSVIFARR